MRPERARIAAVMRRQRRRPPVFADLQARYDMLRGAAEVYQSVVRAMIEGS